jgi:hypothetical protein
MTEEPDINQEKSTPKPDPSNRLQQSLPEKMFDYLESRLRIPFDPKGKEAIINTWNSLSRGANIFLDDVSNALNNIKKTSQTSSRQSDTAREENPKSESSSSEVNVNNFGYYLDGWAELVEDMSPKADEVRKQVVKSLHEREMPDIQVIDERIAFVSIKSKERRKYAFTTTHPGIVTTINISEFGKDLFVAWATYIRPILNIGTIIIILMVALLFGLSAFGASFASLGSSMVFYRNAPGIAVSAGVVTFLFVLIITAFGVGIAGKLIKGYSLAYFLIEPTVFDADDITAMSLAAHKSILRSLDATGFDTKKLRLKQDFKRGRRGELV